MFSGSNSSIKMESYVTSMLKNPSIRTYCIFSCKHFLNRLIGAALCHYSTKRTHGVNILLFRLIGPPKFVSWDLTNVIFRCSFLYSVRWCRRLSNQEWHVNFTIWVIYMIHYTRLEKPYLIRYCIENCYDTREATTDSNTNDTSQSNAEYNKKHIKCQKDYAKPAK